MRIRSRSNSVTGPMVLGQQYYDSLYPYGNGPWVNPVDLVGRPPSSTSETSREEWCGDELHPGPPYRTGGPLSVFKWETNEYAPLATVDMINHGSILPKYRYIGSHQVAVSLRSLFPWNTLENYRLLSGDDDAEDYGAAGWNRFRPTRSGAELGVFLGELREVPRMLKTTAKGFHDVWRSMGGSATGFGPKSVANHWLNTQFGWLPFLSDLRSFVEVTKNLDKKLNQLRRDNNQWVRRGGNVLTESESEVVLDQTGAVGLFPALSYFFYETPTMGRRHAVYSRSKHVWFEGRFKYWIPGKPGTLAWDAKALSQIYGLRPGPSVLWELTPWSWLIDWCTDAGDAIANLDSIMFDNLCAKYAYSMATTKHSVSYTGTNYYLTGAITGSASASYTCKHRAAASPFGFGLTNTDFSARQWSILSALGITRLR